MSASEKTAAPQNYDTSPEGIVLEEEEMEEIEVTDDEEGEEGEDDGEAEGSGAVEAEVKSETTVEPPVEPPVKPKPVPEPAPKPVHTPKKTPKPGKVKPSEEVKSMKMKSPVSPKVTSRSSLSPDKNPFPTYGGWTSEELDEIEIVFPVLSGKNESTNELTRKNRPESRYWKAPVVFKYSTFTSNTIKFDNVVIPHCSGVRNYGTNFVYVSLPSYAAEKFAEAGKKLSPTNVFEPSLQPDKSRWWKTCNNIEGTIGVISKETKKFHPKSVDTIFESTSAGIAASVILEFTCKAHTEEMQPIKPTSVRTLAVELRRGYIEKTDVNVPGPIRIKAQKAKVEIVASSKDVAEDSLMQRLAELGL